MLLMFIIVSASFSTAQTVCYKYLYNITSDGVKKTGAVMTSHFYFTFNRDKSAVFQTDKNGYYTQSRGNGEYRYIGSENGMLIYRSQNDKYDWNFLPVEYIYFSTDFKRMNWDCGIEKFNKNGDLGVRVLEQYDPQKGNTPEKLY